MQGRTGYRGIRRNTQVAPLGGITYNLKYPGVNLPTDFMSESEIAKMSGECRTVKCGEEKKVGN